MQQQVPVVKRRVALMFSATAMYVVALNTVPDMVARHGGRPVWAIVPLIAGAGLSFAYMVRDLARAKLNGGFDGLQ